MALIKGNNKDGAAAPAAPALLRRSLITRGNLPDEQPADEQPPRRRVFEGLDGDEEARREFEQRESEAPFEHGLPASTAAGGKVFGNLHRTTNTLLRTLPQIQESVRVPTSESEANAIAQGQPPQSVLATNHDHGGGQQAPTHHHQPQQHQGPPVDQAIIEEAQRKAQQVLMEAQEQAQQYMQSCQQQVQQQMQEANVQIQQAGEQVQKQAQEMGFKQGYEAGLQQGAVAGQQALTQLILQARDIYVQAIRQRHMLLKGAEPQLARLASKIAEKVIGIEVDSNSQAVVGVVRSCIDILGDREEVSIRVNPRDLEAVRAQRTVFEKMVEGLRKFEIVGDASIDPGGCSIETNLGNIDARLTTQIATIQAALENAAKAQDLEVSTEADNMVVDFPEMETAPPPEGAEAEG